MKTPILTTRTEIDQSGLAVIYAEGDIDIATSGSFQADLGDAFERAKSVAVDLSRVRYIDSSGLSALVWGNRAALQAGGSLAVRRPSAAVQRLLKITGLDAVIVVVDDGDEPRE